MKENRMLKNFILTLGAAQTVLFVMYLKYILAAAPAPLTVLWGAVMLASTLACLVTGGVMPRGDKLCK